MVDTLAQPVDTIPVDPRDQQSSGSGGPEIPYRSMTEQEYEAYVSQWIGIPYALNGNDPAIGLDCRTLAIHFLRGQGIGIRGDDGVPLPEQIDAEVIKRYEVGVRAAGVTINLRDLRCNDLVYYFNKLNQLHVGVWLGYDRILTTGQPYKSFIYRIKREHLAGAVRGTEGIFLDDRGSVLAPPAHPPVVAVLAAIGTAVTLGVAAGTTAVVIGAIVVGGAVAAAVHFGLGAMASGRRPFDFNGSPAAGLDASNRYAFDGAQNIRTNQSPVPLIYSGLGIRVLQTYEIWNSGTGQQSQKRLVVIGEGELGSISQVQLNGSDIATFSGCSYTAYVGTPTQGVDARAAGTNVVGLKNTAYLALTLQASDQLSGDPVITCVVTGRKVNVWNGSNWTSAAIAASGNPAAIIRDYLTLSRERGGCGFAAALIDDASFGAVYDWAEATVTNLDQTTEPRARLDMIIDASRPWLDNLQDMLATFGGFLVTDGRKFSLRVEKSESPVQAFTDDQMWDVEYQTFSKDDRPNRLVGVYIDPTTAGNDARTRVSVDDLTDQAVNPRGIVPREVNLLGLSRQTQTIREITKIANDLKVNWYSLTFSTDVNALALEPGDVISVTHPILGDGVTAYQFRVQRILEHEDHTRKLVCKAYNSSIFGDTMEQQAVTLNYTPPPNPFAAIADVTGLTVQAVGFLQVDGNFYSTIQVTWVEPVEKLNLQNYAIEWSENGGAYEERAIALPGSTKVVLHGAKVGATYQIKVRTVSKVAVKSSGAISGNLTVNGDTAKPLDVTGFDASQLGDEIRLTWNPNPDVDIWGYEIREGGTSWATSNFVDGPIQATKYSITQFAAGTKTYRIKAIDASQNYSLNDAADSLVATAPSDSNIVLRYDLFNAGLRGGAFSSDLEIDLTNEFATGYYRPAIAIKTIKTLENNTDSWETLESTLNWDTQARPTMDQTYTSEIFDVGSIQTAIASVAYKNYLPDGAFSVEWAYSDTNPNPSTFVAFSEGVYTLRYFKLRVHIKTNTASAPARNYEFNLQMDVKDLIDRGTDVSIAAAGTTITFTKNFSQTPSIGITTNNNPYIPYITAKSKTSFTVKLRDPSSGLDVAGSINWIAKGF